MKTSELKNGVCRFIVLAALAVFGHNALNAQGIEKEQDLFRVVVDGKWGFIDRNGIYVIEPTFKDASGFSEGYAAVQVGNTWRYVNERGKFSFGHCFDDANDFHEGLALLYKGEKCVFV